MARPPRDGLGRRLSPSARQVVEEDVDDRRGVEREHLAEQQSAHHGDAQRPAKLRADAGAKANGRPASSAAIVVIMIGRKRSRQAS